MTSSTNGGQAGGPGAAGTPGSQPQLNVLTQYTKDLSFENPNAPHSFQNSQQPQIGVQINVAAQPLSESDVEVSLRIEGKADVSGSVLFAFELVYAGVFRVQNVPQENMAPLLMIECPRILFPFAREIVANAVRNGGFPPLLLDPVDFVALFRQQMAQQQQMQTSLS